MTPPSKIRVALAYTADNVNQSLSEVLLENLEFNGANATDNSNDVTGECHPEDGCFKLVNMPDPTEGMVDFSQAIQDLTDFQPDVVLLLVSQGTFYNEGMMFVEDAFDQAGHKPYWVTSLIEPALIKYVSGGGDIAAPADLYARILGVETASSSGTFYENFQLKYEAQCPDLIASLAGFPPWVEHVYDAVYLSAYSHLAETNYNLSADQLTGQQLAKGLGDLAPAGHEMPGASQSIDLKAGDIGKAFNALVTGNEIDVRGRSGELDFDITTGFPQNDVEITCIYYDSNGDFYDETETGWVWRAADDTLEGSYDFNCAPQ
jgi:hypothetical protein